MFDQNPFRSVRPALEEAKNKEEGMVWKSINPKVSDKATKDHKKLSITKGIVSSKNEKLDPVDDQDADIDNDGIKNDPNDKYLKNRRKKVKKAIKKGDEEDVVMNPKLDNKNVKEGTWALPKTAKQKRELLNLMKKPIKLGKEGDDASGKLYNLVGDDSLFDDLYTAGKKNPNGDARPIIKKHLKQWRIPGLQLSHTEYEEEKMETQNKKDIRGILTSILEKKDKHTAGATPPEMMKDKLKGKGAHDMMEPAEKAIADPALDEPEQIKQDRAKMTSNVKVAGGRPGDNKKGDKKIVPPGTPMKDPAAPKVNEETWTKLSNVTTNVVQAYKSMSEKKSENLELDEDVLSENLLSRLTGGHGRYMNKLKLAHSHHTKMGDTHGSIERGLGKAGSDDEHSDEEGNMSMNHYLSHEEHHDAANAIKKLMDHAKKNKLTHHPVSKSTDSEGHALLHKARKASVAAHASSHDTLATKKSYFVFRSSVRPKHMDRHTDLLKSFRKTKYESGDHHKNLK